MLVVAPEMAHFYNILCNFFFFYIDSIFSINCIYIAMSHNHFQKKIMVLHMSIHTKSLKSKIMVCYNMCLCIVVYALGDYEVLDSLLFCFEVCWIGLRVAMYNSLVLFLYW